MLSSPGWHEDLRTSSGCKPHLHTSAGWWRTSNAGGWGNACVLAATVADQLLQRPHVPSTQEWGLASQPALLEARVPAGYIGCSPPAIPAAA